MAKPGRQSRTESAQRNQSKSHGIHYTPSELARFLAVQTLSRLSTDRAIAILDPACGDGSLLAAAADLIGERGLRGSTLVGIDRDPSALEKCAHRLAPIEAAHIELVEADFLAHGRRDSLSQMSLFQDTPAAPLRVNCDFDVVISNPPYVRTQVLGAATSRELARQYGLTGRVDLYHAFVRAMTDYLREDGILGLLCSNRFLSTLAGASLRELLWKEYELCEIFDLGDTKLFTAAVLPAIVIARRRSTPNSEVCTFSRIYEQFDVNPKASSTVYPSVLCALNNHGAGLVKANGSTYKLERGILGSLGSPSSPWTLFPPAGGGWLETVERHTRCTFGDVGPIRVGIKTTADEVFVRDDWDMLPNDLRPEDDLLRPLLTHHVAAPWRVAVLSRLKRVLYPHTTIGNKRMPIDLEKYPRAKAYLECWRQRLAARAYVTAAGRQWFELWVPQQPSEWAKPKLVFPDISESARFFLDTSGAVVNGDCYWITPSIDLDPEIAYVMMAVANSAFALKFYDATCTNRLYAGRRRFMTQYVKRFPIPRTDTQPGSWIAPTVRKLLRLPGPSAAGWIELEQEINRLVWRSFGFAEEASGQLDL